MALIEFKKINKIYGKKETEIFALKDISLKINQGEMIAVVGASGSGKSTFLNIIGLIDKVNSGEYLLDNQNVNNFSDKRLSELRNKNFGFIIQNYALINDYTVYENVEIPISYSKNKSDKKNRIKKILGELGIEHKIKSKCSELSGGQSQRVAIARALINNPDVILADEPTGSLDQKTGDEVLAIFEKINKNGKTIIIVTHNVSVANICHKIIKIKDGQIEFKN
ncbi:MAG: ABC transporter ATP-binding protein [Firmicutes bacterium]|nr:ABC transporter ATP-binding protein [Bacillota bacterium]